MNHTIESLILDSYGLDDDQEEKKSKPKSGSIMECKTLVRVMKYRAPPEGEYMRGLHPHTDKLMSTILCDDQVDGLEVETKDGHRWLNLSISPTSFVFLVGDPLMVCQN